MKLWHDRPSVYNMSIEELDKILDKLTDKEEELLLRDEPDKGIMREEWKLLAQNVLTYADATTYHLSRHVRSYRLRQYAKYLKDNRLDGNKYSFSDWEKEHIK